MTHVTVFLIDDDQDDHEIFRMALDECFGQISFVGAYDGIDALNQAGSDDFPRPDVIFLDINMPRMDGRTFLKEWSALERYRHIPIIVYSTSSAPADLKHMLDLGAASYMVKPSAFSVLCSELRQIFNDQSLL